MKPALLLASCLTVATGVLLACAPALAQTRVYRCGNEYTNQIKGRTDCKPIQGGNVTIIGGTKPPAANAAAPARNAGGGASTTTTRADSAEQRAKDADAKVILEAELRRAESQQADMEKEYNNGEPDKIGGEARNHQKYLDRVAEMKAAIERNQSDIDGIKRELARFNR
ncbi:MAG: hypothetical protein LBQ32_01930 [Burkholderiaceae bacterium]|jgi:hypothetical protein|nr:hypothetical protein [Burkholderiaceae bacterium]